MKNPGSTTHGYTIGHGHGRNTPLPKTYLTWIAMRQRCQNVNSSKYPIYGGRGIMVCERWSEFENFVTDMGERPAGMTIERIDNNGDYSPENCRWATHKEQGINKRNSIRLTLDGETKPLLQWAKEIGLTANTLHMRIWRGWTAEEALTQPKRKGKRNVTF